MADEKEIKIKKSVVEKIIFVAAVVFIIAMFTALNSPYTAPLVFTTLLLLWGSYYAVVSRESMSEMCCMMSGMAFGMMAGFFVGAIVGLATLDFFVGMVVGTVAGVLFGIPVGRIGGPLGRMEGVMAGPMGGIMGAMTGVMVSFFNVTLFMPFLAVVAIFTVWEMTRVVKTESKSMSRNFVYIGIILSVLAFSSTIANGVSLEGGTTGFVVGSQQLQQAPPVENGIQQVTIKMNPTGYEPNYIVLKKDVPAKITLQASNSASCTHAIVFSAFGIRENVPSGTSKTVEFTPSETGTFPFNCAMNMARGTIVVQ